MAMTGAENRTSPFTDELAAEIWDARYRWREQGVLRDRNIEATCERVAKAIAAAEPHNATVWARRFSGALLSFQLLPDDAVWRNAGTETGFASATAPAAVLNLSTFVRAPLSATARFDHDALASAAELAVRMLDDVASQRAAGSPSPGLRIGLIGCADALLLLGLRYGNEPARTWISTVTRTLAEACLRAAISLARDRGVSAIDTSTLVRRLQDRQTASELIRDVKRHGVRYVNLTAIESQPWLALLANNSADALDPLTGANAPYRIMQPGITRTIRSSGAAIALMTRLSKGMTSLPHIDSLANATITAQLHLRAAAQPWIDAPIDYPMPVAVVPDTDAAARLSALAERLRVPAPAWRHCPPGFLQIYDS